MLTDAQKTAIKMQRLLIENEKERKQAILNFTSFAVKGGLGIYKNIQETKQAKENAEVNRALNIANSYMSSKIQTDLKTKADYGEQSYRDELSNYDIFSIQTIQELNLSDSAKEKLQSAWQENKPNLLSTYEATLPSYQMTGLMNEIDKEASTIYNNDINTDIFEGLKQYKEYTSKVNPNGILIKGNKNLLLEDDHNSLIVGGRLANRYNEVRHTLDFNADTTLKDLIKSEKENCLKNTDSEDKGLYATEYKILSDIENNETLQNEIIKTANDRENEKNKYIQTNVNETCTTFQNNLTQMLADYKIENNKAYVLDTRTDVNGNFSNDSLGILNSVAKQLDTIDNLNISPSLKLAQKGQILATTRDSLGDNLINGLFDCDSYEEAYSSLGLLDNDNKLIKELFENTDTQERGKNLLDYAKENKIDISTEEGKNTLKYLYKEYGSYTDTDLRKVKKIRDAYDILDKDKFITYLRNQGLDANTQETLIKEYTASQSKYAPQIKNYFDSYLKETRDKFYNNENYKEKFGLERKTDYLPQYLQNALETSYYNYLIEHGEEINYTDPKELEKLTRQLNNSLAEYLDGDVEIFATIDSDLKDLNIDDPQSLGFIYKSQQNLIFSNGFNKVFDYLNNGYSRIKLEDVKKNQSEFLDQIASKYYGEKDFNSLNLIQQTEAKGGLAYFRVLKTQEKQIKNGLNNFDRTKNKQGETISKYSIDKVEFDIYGNPRYVLKDNSTDKEGENIRNNIALVLTPSRYLQPSQTYEIEKIIPNTDRPTEENLQSGNYQATTRESKKLTTDNYIISCALKDSSGNILWDTISDQDLTKDNYIILKLLRNLNESEEEEINFFVNQRDLLNKQIKQFASKNNIF